MGVLKALVVVEFDVGVGQVPRLVVPAGALSSADAAKLAYLALPDSNASVHNDLVYCFRFRTDSLPLFSTSALGHQYSFGCAFFRQQRDRSFARGYIQKSVVAVAQLPYVGLLKKLVCTVGPRLFAAEASGVPDAPRTLLSAAFDEVSRWPQLVPGTTVLLPLLGECLPCQVPWTGLENYRPSFIALSRPPPGHSHRRAAVRSGSVASSLSNAAFSASCTSLSPTEAVEAAADFGALSAVQEAPLPFDPISQACGLSPLPPAHSEDAEVRAEALSPRAPLDGGGGVAALTLAEVFATKSLELAGLFQEVGLYSVFRGLSSHLWHMWELVITGQPIMVIGASPAHCGDAVLALVSLISPLEFCADYRPYFTLFDPDFQQVAAMLDAHQPQTGGAHARSGGVTRAPRHVRVPQPAQRGGRSGGGGGAPQLAALPALPEPDLDPRLLRLQPSHPLIIGSTNPYFTKALQSWPNAVWLGSASGGAHLGGGACAGAAGGAPASVSASGDRHRSSSTATVPDASGAGAAPGAFTTPRKAELSAKGSSASMFPSNARRSTLGASAGDSKRTGGSAAHDAPPATGIVDTSAFAIGPPLDANSAVAAVGLPVRDTEPRTMPLAPTASFPASSGAAESVSRSSEGGGRRRASASAIAAPAPLSGVLKVVSAVTPLFDVLPTSSLHHWPTREARGDASSAGAGRRGDAGVTASAIDHNVGTESGCIVVRNGALVPPDRSLLRQLYRTPLTATAADGGSSSAAPAHPISPVAKVPVAAAGPSPVRDHDNAGQGSVRSRESVRFSVGLEHPTVAINNVLLRQHFRALTLAFVAPFEPYFTLDPRLRYDSSGALVAGRVPVGGGQPIRPGGVQTAAAPGSSSLQRELQARQPPLMQPLTAGSYGPYDDYTAAMLPKFDEEGFLLKLARDGGPKHPVLAASKWLPLYRGFLSSPHFHPWFHARRREVSRQLFELTRSLRLNTSVPEMLLSAVGPAAQHFLDAATWRQDRAPAAEDRRRSEDSQASVSFGGPPPTMNVSPQAAAASPPAASSPPPLPLVRSGKSPVSSGAVSDSATLRSQDSGGTSLQQAAMSKVIGRPPANPGPLARVVGRGTPHAAALAAGGPPGGPTATPTATGLPPPPLSPPGIFRQSSGASPMPPVDLAHAAATEAACERFHSTHPVQETQPPPGSSPASRSSRPLGPPPFQMSLSDASSSGDEADGGEQTPWQFDARPVRRLTPADILAFDDACIELHHKISACFVRETGLLAEDTQLSQQMCAHLDALEALMPERLLGTLAHRRGAAPLAEQPEAPVPAP